MICTKSIVECLRDNAVDPTAFASEAHISGAKPENALNYESDNIYNANHDANDKYFGVDFKQKVSISSYQIKTASSGCYWLYQWKAYVSNDDVSYEEVDSQTGFPVEKTFNLSSKKNARYFKIEGNANSACSSKGMAMYYVKFYGSLKPESKQGNVKSRRYYRGPSLLLIQIISLYCS